jgi:inosose dehydratase
MSSADRREFLKAAAAGTGTLLLAQSASAQDISRIGSPRFSLGVASYTFRAFGLDDTLNMTRRLGVPKVSFKSFHLPLEATPEEIGTTVDKVKASGLELYALGVIYMKSEAEARHAFEYAKNAGVRMIVGVPDHEFLPLAEQLVQQYDIRLAIHNHGPTDKVYPTPESAYQKIQQLDRRIGLCLDVGHTRRSGLDPAAEFLRHIDRVMDVHIKDVTEATENGGTCEIGRGVTDIPALLRALISTGYAGVVSLEFEKDEKDPLPGCAESIGYLRGFLASKPGA